ncbi:MAG: hypothetical protein ACI89J_003382 [Hyphomicrobiaceae bacterium]|jgi:hypothetical protein
MTVTAGGGNVELFIDIAEFQEDRPTVENRFNGA